MTEQDQLLCELLHVWHRTGYELLIICVRAGSWVGGGGGEKARSVKKRMGFRAKNKADESPLACKKCFLTFSARGRSGRPAEGFADHHS